MSEEKKTSVLASVAKLFTPDPNRPSAPPPSCCGECGGAKNKDSRAQEQKS